MNIKTESLRDFYQRTKQSIPEELLQHTVGAHFNVKRRIYVNRVSPYNRRDFYKICLATGKGLHFSNNTETLINEPSLLFASPHVPLSYQSLDEEQGGFYCLFNEPFLLNGLKQEIKYESPLFNDSLQSIFTLNELDLRRFSDYFSNMEALLQGSYRFKFDMIRSILITLIHESIKLQQPGLIAPANQADKAASRFFSLLDQQFPVDSPANPLQLTTPSGYAKRLNIHVNYLNNLVKRTTGKTTGEIIRERIIAEAKILLLSTDWDAAEIAYALGFEYPSHFNKYFKQHTCTTPLLFREDLKRGSLSNNI